MKAFCRMLRICAGTTLFFFSWTYLPVYAAVAYAVTNQKPDVRGQKTENSRELQPAAAQRPGERFEKAFETIRENIEKADEKASKGRDITAEIAEIRAKKTEIETLDVELRKEFATTEKKLKDVKLPNEILDRHYRFVKHYEDNFRELKTNLAAIGKPLATNQELRAALQKAKLHLEKTKAPSRHQKLDPDNLPNRMVKAKARMPRLKKEDFEKDFPKQKKKKNNFTAEVAENGEKKVASWFGVAAGFSQRERTKQKPVLVASNGPLAGLFSSDTALTNPQPNTFSLSSSVNSVTNEVAPLSASSLQRIDASTPLLLAASTLDLPTADDLAETPEIQFTKDIQNLAAQLSYSPVKIFEWVKNNIEFVPTYGSIQGANMCLQTQQCNDIDTASLLIALLRVSNIPAHYAYGTIEIRMDKVMNWAGGFTNPTSALNFIASGNIPVTSVISGGTITAARMEHVWVEAYIPYGNYRGAIMDQSLKTWISIDGSFKQYTYTNGFDITATVPFSQDAYLSQVQTQNAIHYYQSQIQTYLDANMPDTSIVDVKGYRQITQETYHFLPSTLPYKTVVAGNTFSAAPDSEKATVTFTLSNPATSSNASYTVSTAALAGKRITVSYVPATAADDALIASYGGFLYNVPAYMLNLSPVLKVEGTIKLTGEATTLGSEQGLSMLFTQPNGNNETRDKKLIAGAYYAIAMDLQGINENVLGKRNYQLNTNVLSQTAGTLGNDDLIGEHLFILATTYFLADDKEQKAGAKLFNVAIARTISEGITSFTLTVANVFGVPTSAMPSGINMDVAMSGVTVSARDGNTSKELAYMDLHGLVGSYNEHDIFEKIDGFSSVSAVKALQTAAANGILIEQINAGNIGQMLPTLQVNADVQADIQNAVNAGKEVTISQSNVQINDWNGVGYIVKDPITGAGAYMISGGLAGSDSTKKQDGLQIVQIYQEPFGWVKDNIDPLTRDTIATAAELELGEVIAVSSNELVDAGYDDVKQCSGLVRIAYWAAGICLDEWSPWAQEKSVGSCGKNNLVTINKISGTNGVSYHYNLADKLKIHNSVRQSNDPLIGDIVFFNNTSGPGHPLSHEGIVISSPNDKGMVRFIHATKSDGVHESQINILMPTSNVVSDPDNGNDWIGSFCPKGAGNPCLAAALFGGYGTIRNMCVSQ